MDSPSIPKNFNYNSSQQPMFTVTETPIHYRSFSQNKFTFEDISFSHDHPNPGKTRAGSAEDTEISIFDAQKYFSNDPKQDQPSDHDVLSVSRFSSVGGYGTNYRTRSFQATPTASSEASWNSQSGLLGNRPGSAQVSLKNVPSHHHSKKWSSKKWTLGRKCCCTGSKSVDIKDLSLDSESRGPNTIIRSSRREIMDTHQPKTDIPNPPMPKSDSNSVRLVSDHLMLKLDNSNNSTSTNDSCHQRVSATGRPFVGGNNGFSFPILNPSSPAKPELKGIRTEPIISPIEDPPRDSLEVFQPISMTIPVNARAHFSPGSPIARVMNTDDDVGSDASSDLFEIESFSTQTTSYPMYRRRDSLEDAPNFNARRFAPGNSRRSLDEPTTPSVAGTECYAPSEVSVDWSVTTAEGYDRASVTNFSVSASEFGGAAFLRRRMEEAAAEDGEKRKGNAGGGLLMMGCRQEKAVSVGPQPVKYMAAVEGPSPAMLPLHVGGRPQRGSKPPMGSCNSSRLSLAFAA